MFDKYSNPDLIPWCICCGRSKAICRRDKGCGGVDPTAKRGGSYAKAYYEGGHRMVIDGTPIRVASIVATWKPWMKSRICKGLGSVKEQHEATQQWKQLRAQR